MLGETCPGTLRPAQRRVLDSVTVVVVPGTSYSMLRTQYFELSQSSAVRQPSRDMTERERLPRASYGALRRSARGWVEYQLVPCTTC